MRSIITTQFKQTRFSRLILVFHVAGCLLLLSAHLSSAQNVPIVSGALGFLDSTNTGVNFFQPVAAPVIVAPLGKHFLAESRFDLRGLYIPKNGTSGPLQASFLRTTQYLQLDYLASEKLTLTAGRFLTPFGTYNERLTAIWIPKFQDAPLIFPIGTRTTGSSNGVMARGVLLAKPLFHIDYIGYFSASSNVPQFQAGRAAGYRFDVYFPTQAGRNRNFLRTIPAGNPQQFNRSPFLVATVSVSFRSALRICARTARGRLLGRDCLSAFAMERA